METDDKIFDQLIAETLERKQMEDQLARQVMQTLRRNQRRAALRRWSHIVAFAFGVPAVLLSFIVGTVYIYTHTSTQPYTWIATALATATILAFLAKEVKDFPINEL